MRVVYHRGDSLTVVRDRGQGTSIGILPAVWLRCYEERSHAEIGVRVAPSGRFLLTTVTTVDHAMLAVV